MRILISNDDGIHAPGIALLERIARTLTEDVWVVAPSSEQSGKGRSLTLTAPIRMRSLDDRHHAVSGTPTDAIIMALGEVMTDRKPDLVLSGINRGANLGEDVSYSGTVAAAQEGALAGIPAIALSQCYARPKAGHAVTFEVAEAWGRRVLEPLVAGLDRWSPRTLVNVNFPPVAVAAVRGIRVVRQGLRDYGRPKLDKGTDPRGFAYWWLGLGRVPHERNEPTDLTAVEEGYVTVTPLHLDMTHDASRSRLEELYR